MITKQYFLDAIDNLGCDENYFEELTDNFVRYYALDDPYGEKEHSYLDALLHVATDNGFREARKAYKHKLLIADRTISALRNKHHDFTTKGNTI